MDERGKTLLLVGLGGIGAPAAMVLARSTFTGTLRVCDDDVVDVLNLHRQILFGQADIGRSKAKTAARLAREGLWIDARETRATPETIAALLDGVDVVLDGSDNFATKFLVADAARLARIPVVTAAAVEWRGTVFSARETGACYRCLFEDVPAGPTPACADVGVMGPIVGLVGALAADAALRLLAGAAIAGEMLGVAADGRVRRHRVAARPGCALCGTSPRVTAVVRAHYTQGLEP